MAQHSHISVVIPTYNRKDPLRKCMTSLIHQTYPASGFELIVVDDGSTDGTQDYLTALCRETASPRVVCLRQPNKGPAAARNLGARSAQGEIVAFTDDDCVTSEDWIEIIAETFEKDPELAACGAHLHPTDQNPEADRFLEFEYAPLSLFPTANCAVSKEVFDAVGGFDESFGLGTGEDCDLIYRFLKRGFKVCHVSKLTVHHEEQRSWLRHLKQRFRFGSSNCIVFKRHFSGWFVLDLPFARIFNRRQFIYFKKSPVTGYLRLDFLKILFFLCAVTCFNGTIGVLSVLLFIAVFGFMKGYRSLGATLYGGFIFGGGVLGRTSLREYSE